MHRPKEEPTPPQRTQQHGKAKFSQNTTALVNLGDVRCGQDEISPQGIGINLGGQAIALKRASQTIRCNRITVSWSERNLQFHPERAMVSEFT